MRRFLFPSRRRESGQVIVIAALTMMVLIGFAALSIDYSYLSVSKDELRRASDAAALAAASQLIHNDYDMARNEAVRFGAANTVAGRNVVIDPGYDVEFGQMQMVPGYPAEFQSGATPIDSVRVTVRYLADNANGALPTFFASVLGKSQVEMTASSVASVPDKRVMFVLDISGSMDDDTQKPPDMTWSDWNNLRYDYYAFRAWKIANPHYVQPIYAMKEAAVDFVNRLDADEDKIGLVSYESSATTISGMTFDFQLIRNEVMDLYANGCTNVGAGIQKGLESLEADPYAYLGTKVIILLSDGCANRPYNTSYAYTYAIGKAEECAELGVKVFTISLGSGADRTLMAEIADITQAETFHAPRTEDLPAAFNTIFERIPPRLSM